MRILILMFLVLIPYSCEKEEDVAVKFYEKFYKCVIKQGIKLNNEAFEIGVASTFNSLKRESIDFYFYMNDNIYQYYSMAAIFNEKIIQKGSYNFFIEKEALDEKKRYGFGTIYNFDTSIQKYEMDINDSYVIVKEVNKKNLKIDFKLTYYKKFENREGLDTVLLEGAGVTVKRDF